MSDDRRSASGTGWRRPVLGAIGAVAVIVAVAAVVTRDDEPVSLDASPYSGPLPTVEALATRAPEATGSVSGFVGTGCRGSEDCEGGRPARLDLAALDAPEELPRAENVELGDGRWLESTPTGGTAPWGERAMPEWWLVDPADDSRLSLGAGFLGTATVLPDGRIAMVWTPITEEGTPELRTIDARGEATRADLPGGFRPTKIAPGPDGWYAVLGSGDDCCDVRLLLVEPGGAQRQLLFGNWTAAAPLTVSWGAAGYIAVGPEYPDHWDEGNGASWVTVVDPRAGEIEATLDGWVGTAWSPDAPALLVAQPTDAETTELALVWGPSFGERTSVGTVAAAFTPHEWAAPEP